MADGAETPFPPIGDYGFLSDCHTGALVAPDGSIEWLCLPRFDSPSVLTAILDRGAGSFRFGPCDISVPLARRYVPGTNIIESTWMCDGGWVVVRDALTLAEWDDKPGLSHVRAPISHDAEQMVLRTAECISGAVEIELVCDLAYGYGLTRPSWSLSADGTAAHATGEGPDVRLLCDRPLEIAAGAATSIIRLEEGESCFCGLAWGDDGRDPASVEEASARLDTTSAYWRRWLADGRFPDHPWRIYLQRSALALKGLTYAPTGALLAALTSSLPETPHGERNWDYRFTWVRDATFALWGSTRSGSTTRHATSSSSCATSVTSRSPARCRLCTGSAASATCPRARSTTSAATRARAPCGSATPPTRSAKTTSTAPCSTPSTSTPRARTASSTAAGRS